MQRHRLRALVAAACLLCCCRPSCAEAGIEPFDCRTGLENWRTGWSLDKKRWCCQSHNLGCSAVQEEELAEPSLASDPSGDANATGTAVEASAAQVQRYGPGHCVSTWKTQANHCIVRTDCARQDISRYPIALLCVDSAGGRVRHVFGKDSFAPEETFDTLIICEECKADTGPQGRVGDTKALNATLQAFVREVNEIKQRALNARIEVHSLNSIVHKVYHAMPDERQVSDLFHCDVGRTNWRSGWSKEKKCWCCSMKNVGCEPENVGCVPEVPVVLPNVPNVPFDCSVGVDNHKLGWSRPKKCWCCQTSGIGCDARIACEPDTVAAEAPPPSPKFHCHAGLQNYELGWSDQKKIWCCRAHGLGCATENATRTSKLFNCGVGRENAEKGWSEQKKKWCCSHRGVGCQLDPYDCRQDFGTRETHWTAAKKYWCCQKNGMGCAPDDTRYDCFTGLHDPERLWSLQKRRWCCRIARIGCAWAGAEVRSEVRLPRARRQRAVVSQDARASFQISSASGVPAGRRVAGARARARASSTLSTTTAAPTIPPQPPTVAPTLTEESWKLDVESDERMRQVVRLRQQYLRATSSELAAIAPFRAKAAAAAEEAAEADEVGRLSTWSGPSETEDEIAAQEATRRLQARADSAVEAPTTPPPRQRPPQPQFMLRKAAVYEEAPEPEPQEAAALQAERLDDASSAAVLVESYSRGAWAQAAKMAARARPPSEGRRGRRSGAKAAADAAAAAPQTSWQEESGGTGTGQEATDLWWDNSEDLALGAASLDLDVATSEQDQTNDGYYW